VRSVRLRELTGQRRAFRYILAAANVVAAAYLLVGLHRQAPVAALLLPGGRAELVVPAGFAAAVFAEGLSGPRFITFGPDGRLYVAESGRDRVVALADTTGDGVSDGTVVFASKLPAVHSVAWHDGALYAGVPTGVIELRDADADGIAETRRTVVADLPADGAHSTRTAVFLADGRMVVSVGSSCNVCEETDTRRASILVYDGASGSGERVFAKGLRNAVGLALEPASGELWATNSGRDWLGDDLPPETLHIVKEGDDYGWPAVTPATSSTPTTAARTRVARWPRRR